MCCPSIPSFVWSANCESGSVRFGSGMGALRAGLGSLASARRRLRDRRGCSRRLGVKGAKPSVVHPCGGSPNWYLPMPTAELEEACECRDCETAECGSESRVPGIENVLRWTRQRFRCARCPIVEVADDVPQILGCRAEGDGRVGRVPLEEGNVPVQAIVRPGGRISSRSEAGALGRACASKCPRWHGLPPGRGARYRRREARRAARAAWWPRRSRRAARLRT